MTSWLLLRGLGREARHWGTFPERLAGAQRAVCLDLPGFGTEHARQSPASISAIANDVRERFAAVRGGETWSVLGISLGGMVALEWCARHPRDFERCVVVNSSARDSPMLDRFALAGVRSVLASSRGGPVEKERAVLSLTSDLDPDALSEIALKQAAFRIDRPPHRGAIARQLVAATRFRAPSRIDPPVLVLASRTDRLVSWRCSERIASRSGARLELSESGGHDLALDEPAWICERVRAS